MALRVTRVPLSSICEDARATCNKLDGHTILSRIESILLLGKLILTLIFGS